MKKIKLPAKKQQKKKIIVTSLAVGAAGILGFFSWQYLKKKKQAKTTDLDTLISKINSPIVPESVTPPKPKVAAKKITATPLYVPPRNDGFPLKKGSKGPTVKKLQEALIAKYGAQILPKYGADGDFGSETVNALTKLGLPTTITESTFHVIAQGIPSTNPASIGKELYSAAIKKDFNKVIGLLQKLKTVDDYSAAGEQFKQYRINGVRHTLVNGLLNTFATESQKQKIRFEFLRIGLQFDGSKWSLSGIDGLPIITIIPTTIWINARESVQVPARMVLGNEISRRLDYTLFENKGKYFLVQSKNVKYL
jgi:peptidoglycan hydrolase-like protein with peptidoglycan-binding domain